MELVLHEKPNVADKLLPNVGDELLTLRKLTLVKRQQHPFRTQHPPSDRAIITHRA